MVQNLYNFNNLFLKNRYKHVVVKINVTVRKLTKQRRFFSALVVLILFSFFSRKGCQVSLHRFPKSFLKTITVQKLFIKHLPKKLLKKRNLIIPIFWDVKSLRRFYSSVHHWLLFKKRIRKKNPWAPKWKLFKKKHYRSYTKILKKRLLINNRKIINNKISKRLFYAKYLLLFYKKKLYLKKVRENIALTWLPQKYHRPFMRVKSIRMYFISSYYLFKIITPHLLHKIYGNFKVYSKHFKNDLIKLTSTHFTTLYNRFLHVYFYLRGFGQITRNSVLKYQETPYAIFDYNIKQKDALFKNLSIGLIFYRVIRLWRARSNSHYLGSFDILLNIVTNLDFSSMGAKFISNFCNLQLQKIPNKKMQKWFIGACREFFKGFLLIAKNNRIKDLQFINIKGIQFDVKGRAVDLRRVFVRRKKYGHTYNTKHGYYDVLKSYNFDFFYNKVGVNKYKS